MVHRLINRQKVRTISTATKNATEARPGQEAVRLPAQKDKNPLAV